MDVLRALRLAWLPLLLSACCLDVVPADSGSSTGFPQGITSGGGNTGGASTGNPPGGSSNTGTTSGGGGVSTSPACIYPVAATGIFPDATLGDGWVNFNGAVDSAAAIGSESDLLLQLHCSGERYVLIDISAAWSPYSQGFAQDAPAYTAGWLAKGGLVLTALEQDPTGSGAPASEYDLTSWAAEYQTNYSLVNDPQETLVTMLGISAWPSFYIVRLSDMQIITSQQGGEATIIDRFTTVLNGM